MRAPLLAMLLLSSVALADRGALSVDIGGGGVATTVPALQVEVPKSTISFDVSLWLGLRYALKNNLELSVTGFFEPPATIFQNDVRLATSSGTYPGTTRHLFMRGGAQAGARLLFGMRFKLHIGLEAGWCQSVYSEMQHFDVSREEAVNYGLGLSNVSQPSFVISPLLGIEWVGGDKWSLLVLPRAQLMLGGPLAWALVIPLQFSWSWYL